MALNAELPWLIAYDIADDRRLIRLHHFLRRHAIPVQYSVFMLRASTGYVGRLVKSIDEIIDQRHDDVRIYRVPEPAEADVRGRCMLPDGVLHLTAGPTFFQVPRDGRGGRP